MPLTKIHRPAASGLQDSLDRALAERPRWEPLIRQDAHERVCELLHLGDDVELWLVCWSQGHDTGFHDHDHSMGQIAVVRGLVREERLALPRPPLSQIYGRGSRVTVPSGDIHRVTHVAGAPAVTLHAYSPPLERVGTYAVADDGRLRRHAAPADTVLAAAACT